MILRIYNEIVNSEEAEMMKLYGVDLGICYKDINEFCAAIPEDDNEIDLRIHCVGGSVMEGWAMYDRLRATGKHITATVEGMCASMATVILLAASERKASPNSTFLIHNPAIQEMYGRLTADELQKKSDELRKEQEKILDLYVERTGANRDELAALMDAETMLDAKKALELGFINEIVAPLSAKININLTTAKMTDEKKLSIFDKICALFSGKDEIEDEADASEIKMQDFTTADGGTISVETDTTPKVGDPASPDGEHLMPDGRVIVVADGVITEIRTEEKKDEEQDEATSEIDALKAEIEALKAEIEAQKQSNDTLTQTVEDLKGKADKAQGDADALLEQMKHLSSTYKPEGRTQEHEVATETKSAYFVKRMEEIKAKNKKK